MAKTKPTKKFKQVVTIKTDQDNAEPMELVAKSIIEIAEAFQKIDRSRLKRRTILLLLNDSTGVPMSAIGKILDTAPELAKMYLK